MNDSILKTLIGVLVRHAITLLGGAALFSVDQMTVIAGAVATLVSVVWSIWQKKDTAQTISALSAPVPSGSTSLSEVAG